MVKSWFPIHTDPKTKVNLLENFNLDRYARKSLCHLAVIVQLSDVRYCQKNTDCTAALTHGATMTKRIKVE